MIKKIFLYFVSAMFCSVFVTAQVFEIETNPVEATTTGVTPYIPGDPSGHDFVSFETAVKNISNDSVTLTWTNISDTTQQPLNWLLTGICDNIVCRGEYGSWYYGAPQTANAFAPNATMPLIVHVYASSNDPDGTGTYKIQLSAHGQTDTAVFILTKNTTGISAISLKDNRVSIYPNPVATGNNLNVFINKDLKATKAVIYNIIGREQMRLPVASDKEVNTYNVSSLAPGIYMLRLTDAYGKVITSRKFSKH